MKIKQMFLWGWKFNWLAGLVFFTLMLLINLVSGLIMLANPDTSFNVSQDAAVMVLALVLGLMNFGYGLRWGGVNSVSRRSVYLGLVAMFVTLAAALTAGNALLRLLFFWSPADTGGPFYWLYGSWAAGLKTAPAEFVHLAWMVVVCLFFEMLGYFLGGAFYRLGRRGRICMAVGIPVGLFMVLPLLFTILPQSVQDGVGRLLGSLGTFLMQGPLQMMLVFFGGSVLFAFLAWLPIRKAPILPASLN